MSNGAGQDSATLEKTLRRLEDLTIALNNASSVNASEAARELLELVLDLHGLALARLTSVIVGARDSEALTGRMIADPYIGAILLLHGLHPQSAEIRLREVIERMNSEWARHGFRVDLIGIEQSLARVRIQQSAGAENRDRMRREVEEILINAAPDLDDIVIEDLDNGDAIIANAMMA